jgi:hypothetical protein
MYGWRHKEDGQVVIWDCPSGPEHAPVLHESLHKSFDYVVIRWRPKCEYLSLQFNIPDGWILAMIWRESGGNPRAFNPDGGRGLLQITSPALKADHTDEELYNPDVNLNIGARYIVNLIRRYGHDFPRVSAAFNAGSVRPSTKNPWNMVQTTGHVSSEVAALNYYLQTKALTPDEKREIMASVALVSDGAVDDFVSPSLPGSEPDTNPSIKKKS